MAYLNDKILNGGEILTSGDFTPTTGAFYLMPIIKTGDESIAILSVKLSNGEETIDFPFIVGAWNPVVLNRINVNEGDLEKFRLFWGSE